MKIVNQSAVLLEHNKHPYKFISDVAHTCYKAEPYDEERLDLATNFVKRLVNSKHLAMLEHEYVYFFLDFNAMNNFLSNEPKALTYINIGENYISGSLRAWIEFIPWAMGAVDDEIIRLLAEKYPEIIDPQRDIGIMSDKYGTVKMVSREDVIEANPLGIMNLIPHTIKFITSRGVSHELVRHRPASFAQESQRYVGYDKDKFGHQIEVITPLIDPDSSAYNDWHYAMLMAETQYMNLRKEGLCPEIARGVLPNDCKTEIVVTATETEWQHIINLRHHGTTGKPHPQMKELMDLVYPILQKESNGRIK